MARTSLYSRSPQRPAPAAPALPAAPDAAAPAALPEAEPAQAKRWPERLRRHERLLWVLAAVAGLLVVGWPAWTAKVQRPLRFEQIDAAMRESIAKEPLASAGVAAYEAILPSVVRVVGEPATPPVGSASAPRKGRPPADPHDDPMAGRSVGTGVVIVDKGLILTNLHVVSGAARITVNFADGSESGASVVSLQPENDLAVLQAHTIPDDLHAATMRSTGGLAPGDAVLAVGFPFGIGPSASQGVVSGLKREFRSPEGQRILTNLIQFDAAANPGNSGGPLVTMDGHVVGIVTAIMNPNQQRTFIGIGFAVPIENAAAGAGLPPF
ncbi:MAG: trypsin-like peptidase domain-containing protein [Burkholderiaceae bacterium]|nr:trypsin-like peptidase domain-containing protein [Burkholderiaceae bacterium]